MLTPAEQLAASKGPKRNAHPHTKRWTCHVRKHRNKLGLTMRDVQGDTGLTPATLSNIEYGNDLMLQTAWKLAKFFGKRIDELWEPLEEK